MSPEYEVSLASGAQILSALRKVPGGKYRPFDIFISQTGEWHMNGVPVTLERLKENIDIVWNALHGGPGEDGSLASFLHKENIPYTGSHAFPSAIAFEKTLAKMKLKNEGIKMPMHKVISPFAESGYENLDDYAVDMAKEVWKSFAPPWIMKPVSGGSSLGLFTARTLPELVEVLKEALKDGEPLLVEEHIYGKEATVAVIENFRNQDYYVPIPIEISKPAHEPFRSYMKYGGGAKEIIGGSLSETEKKLLAEHAKKIHQALGLRHYSRSDFIITPRGQIYFLEANALPGLTEHSLVPKMLDAVGVPMHHFTDHIVTLALSER
jgi:D-alanine-D-alanine ligase